MTQERIDKLTKKLGQLEEKARKIAAKILSLRAEIAQAGKAS